MSQKRRRRQEDHIPQQIGDEIEEDELPQHSHAHPHVQVHPHQTYVEAPHITRASAMRKTNTIRLGITVDHTVQQGEILHEEIVNEADIEEEVDLSYIEEDVPPMGGEIVMDEDGDMLDGDDYVEVEASMDDDIASESLLALSQSTPSKLTVRDYLHQQHQHSMLGLKHLQSPRGMGSSRPRILRRNPSGHESVQHSRNMQGGSSFSGKGFPAPPTSKPLLPVAIAGAHQQQKNWRAEQRRMLEIYEIYDNLPEGMRDSFRRLMESRGEKMVNLKRTPTSTKKPTATVSSSLYPHSRIPYRRPQHTETEDKLTNEGEHVEFENPDGTKTIMVMKDASHGRSGFPEGTEFVMANTQEDEEGKPKLMALVPLESLNATEEVEQRPSKGKRSMDSVGAPMEDMPQLEEHNQREEQSRTPVSMRESGQIDVEGYESEVDMDTEPKSAPYILDSDTEGDIPPFKRTPGAGNNFPLNRHIVLPEMRADVFGTTNLSDMQAYRVNDKSIIDNRFCPGCKLTMKRSVYYHHSRMIRKYGVCNMFTPKRFPCGECTERLGTLEKLCEHMYQIHGAPTDVRTRNFRSEDESDKFLEELEMKGGNFRMSRGNKMVKVGLVQYYRCNRMQSMNKGKTMRMCDELQQGVLEPTSTNPNDVDPFVGPAAAKPHLRTEEACTAFFRKAYLQDGSIEIRFCQHHLHDDERLRLPGAIKERILNLHSKKLPAPVIIMILQKERDAFCEPNSTIERLILNLNINEVNAICSARPKTKRKKTLGKYAAMLFERNGVDSKTQQAAEQALRAADSMREAQLLEAADRSGVPSVGREEIAGEEIVEDQGDDDDDEDADLANLTALEQETLEEYEANHAIILTDLQKLKRDVNRRRHLRECIRNKIFSLGRFIRSLYFNDMATEPLVELQRKLDEAESLIFETQSPSKKPATSLDEVRPQLSPPKVPVAELVASQAMMEDEKKQMPQIIRERLEENEEVQEGPPRQRAAVTATHITPRSSRPVRSSAAKAITQMAETIADDRLEQEESTDDVVEVDNAREPRAPPSTRRRGRPRRSVRIEEEPESKKIKEEEPDIVVDDIEPEIQEAASSSNFQESAPNTPSTTKRGRLIKPKTIKDL